MGSTSQSGQSSDQRRDQIRRLLDDVRRAVSAGRSVNEQALLAAHPELMPELGEEFKRLWSAGISGSSADSSGAETIARPSTSATLEETQARPASKVGDDPNVTVARPRREAPPAFSKSAASGSSSVGDATKTDARFESGPGGGGDPGRIAVQIPGYSVQRELSRGGQAVVFIAMQLSTGRKVAIKVMRDGPFADERSMTRFQREVQILAALDHPNIVSIIDTGTTADGSQFIAMPYIAGTTLDEYMKLRHQKDPSDPSKLLRMFYKICIAVNEAHLRGIVHRDLKPSNIRVDERGEPHVLDFGLARTALDRFIRGSDQPVSVTGEFLGSLPWSSPEQAEGDPEKIDMRTDVYSLGVILYQMLTGGRFPYEVVGNIRDVLNNILTTEPKPLSEVMAAAKAQKARVDRGLPAHPLPSINEAIERIVLKALTKRKDARYQTAGELGKDVARYLLGKPTSAGSPGKASGPPKPAEQPEPAEAEELSWAERHWKPLVFGIGSVALLMVSAIVWTYWPHSKKLDAGMAGTEQLADGQTGNSANQVPDATPVPVNSGVASPTPVPPTPVPPGVSPGVAGGAWIDLFNGRDLSGWTATPVWVVNNGTIETTSVGIGRRGQGSTGSLATTREFADFDLKITTKLIQGNVVTLSLDSTNTAVKGFSTTMGSYGVARGLDKTGDIRVNAEMRATGAPNNLHGDQWYTFELIYQGSNLTTLVNGQETARYSDPSLAGMKGRIQISKGNFTQLVQFREIKIRDLSPGAAVTPVVNPVPPGPKAVGVPLVSPTAGATQQTPVRLQSIFNGVNLDGWTPDGPAVWQVNNGNIVGARSAVGAGTLASTKIYKNFRLHLQTMVANGANSFVYVGSLNDGGGAYRILIPGTSSEPLPGSNPGNAGDLFLKQTNSALKKAAFVALKPNEWFSMDVQAFANQISISINEKVVLDYTDPANPMGAGPISFLCRGGSTVRFKDIQIVELDANPSARSSSTVPAIAPIHLAKVGDTWTNTQGMIFAYIPNGQFTMGSPATEAGRNANEIPHPVSFAKPFLMGTTTVTVAQFKAFTAASAYQTDAEKKGEAIVWTGTAADNAGEDSPKVKVKGASWKSPGFVQSDNDPVVEISWADANAYCTWLSGKENRRYRLPTEAEWEYAARAGSATRYVFGDALINPENRAWVRGNSGSHPHPAGQLKPNAWGLFDMSGNVYQWCSDFFGPYAAAAAGEPSGPPTGTEHVTRGGSWDVGPTRTAFRGHSIPDHESNDNGFRVVLELE